MFASGLVVASFLVGAALGVNSVAYSDSGITFQGLHETTHSVTYGFVFPPTTAIGSNATEFIGSITASISNKWVGVALAGHMTNDLLVVAWPNGNTIVHSPRYATSHSQPAVYAGPTITTLASCVNATTWKWIYRCQNCTVWNGGSLNTNSQSQVAWAISNNPVSTPSSASSNFNMHNAEGTWTENFASAHSSNYTSYLKVVSAGCPSTVSSTSTTKTSTTTTSTTTSLPPPPPPTPKLRFRKSAGVAPYLL